MWIAKLPWIEFPSECGVGLVWIMLQTPLFHLRTQSGGGRVWKINRGRGTKNLELRGFPPPCFPWKLIDFGSFVYCQWTMKLLLFFSWFFYPFLYFFSIFFLRILGGVPLTENVREGGGKYHCPRFHHLWKHRNIPLLDQFGIFNGANDHNVGSSTHVLVWWSTMGFAKFRKYLMCFITT